MEVLDFAATVFISICGGFAFYQLIELWSDRAHAAGDRAAREELRRIRERVDAEWAARPFDPVEADGGDPWP